MTIAELKDHLARLSEDLEKAKATVYRCDGALQLIQHLITEEEAK